MIQSPGNRMDLSRTPWTVLLQVGLAMLIFSMHHLAPLLKTGGDYTPFSVGPLVSSLTYDETSFYSPSPRLFMRTGRLPEEIDVYEYRDNVGRNLRWMPLLAVVVGGMGRLFGSLEVAWMAAHVAFPALAWLLIYILAGKFTPSGSQRSLLAWATMLLPFGPRNMILQGEWSLVQQLEFTRIPHPCLSFLLLLAAVWTVCLACESGRWGLAIAAGILSGLQFYTYYFYFVGLFAALGVWMVIAFLTRHRTMGLALLRSILVGVAVGSYYWVPVLRLIGKPGEMQAMAHTGIATRHPDLQGIALALVAMTSIAVLLHRQPLEGNGPNTETSWVVPTACLLALLAGAGVGLNLQLLTGFNIDPDHYSIRLIRPVGCMLLLGSLLKFLVSRAAAAGRAVNAACVAGTLALLAVAGFRQVTVSLHTLPDHLASRPVMEMLKWIDEHAPADVVVGATDREMVEMISAITSRWSFVTTVGRTTASQQEILNRYLILAFLEGKTWDQVIVDLASEGGWGRIHVALNYTLGRPDSKLLNQAKEFWATLDPSRELSRRRLDLVILPVGLDPLRFKSLYPNMKEIHSNREWALWACEPS